MVPANFSLPYVPHYLNFSINDTPSFDSARICARLGGGLAGQAFHDVYYIPHLQQLQSLTARHAHSLAPAAIQPTQQILGLLTAQRDPLFEHVLWIVHLIAPQHHGQRTCRADSVLLNLRCSFIREDNMDVLKAAG